MSVVCIIYFPTSRGYSLENVSGRFAWEKGALGNRKVSKKEKLVFSRTEFWLAQLNTRLRGQLKQVSNKWYNTPENTNELV